MAVIGGGESWRLEGWLEGGGCYDNFDSYPQSSEFDLKGSTFLSVIIDRYTYLNLPIVTLMQTQGVNHTFGKLNAIYKRDIGILLTCNFDECFLNDEF